MGQGAWHDLEVRGQLLVSVLLFPHSEEQTRRRVHQAGAAPYWPEKSNFPSLKGTTFCLIACFDFVSFLFKAKLKLGEQDPVEGAGGEVRLTYMRKCF